MFDLKRFLGLTLASDAAMVAIVQGVALALCSVALIMAVDELRQSSVLPRWFGGRDVALPPAVAAPALVAKRETPDDD